MRRDMREASRSSRGHDEAVVQGIKEVRRRAVDFQSKVTNPNTNDTCVTPLSPSDSSDQSATG